MHYDTFFKLFSMHWQSLLAEKAGSEVSFIELASKFFLHCLVLIFWRL